METEPGSRTADATPSDLSGQVLGKRYLVRRLIGSGGMGAVYEVEHLVTKRVGALKLLHPRYANAREVVARFVMEASAAVRIDNPHVVQIFDAGELDGGEPYMFMELLAGTSLSSLIQSRGRLPFDEAREIVQQAAAGLAAVHAAGIVHRDVKPENLFICRGDGPSVKVLDFGISKFAPVEGDPRLTHAGAPLGTPSYMSPEQVVGQRELDARTDVYSLGVVLYECLTGAVPFQAETLPTLGIRIAAGDFKPASELATGLPPGVDQCIGRAMHVDVSSRFPSMAAFAEALGSVRDVSDRFGATAPSLELGANEPSARRRWLLPLLLAGCALSLSLVFAAWRAAVPRDTSGSVAPSAPVSPSPRPTLRAASSEASATVTSLVRPAASVEAQRPRRAAPAKAALAPVSSAAKDGLSVENPF
ncbi:MAG: serine/threonine-protein kinase [Polyangiaceae bacterium]